LLPCEVESVKNDQTWCIAHTKNFLKQVRENPFSQHIKLARTQINCRLNEIFLGLATQYLKEEKQEGVLQRGRRPEVPGERYSPRPDAHLE
jgi:hypothetical protein